MKADWEDKLVAEAARARKNAYAPYSHFTVGAALLSSDGRIFSGVNVENASYGLTMCAERVAIGNAVNVGVRDIQAVAVATGAGVAPCGACRQVLAEFNPNMQVITVDADGRRRRFSLGELLPNGFGAHDLTRSS